VLGIADQRPPIQERPGSTDVVGGVIGVIGNFAQSEDDCVDSPALQQLGRRLVSRDLPSTRDRKAVEGIVGGIAVVGTRIVAVLDIVIGEFTVNDVQCVGVDVGGREVESVGGALVQCDLERIVAGVVAVGVPANSAN